MIIKDGLLAFPDRIFRVESDILVSCVEDFRNHHFQFHLLRMLGSCNARVGEVKGCIQAR